MNMTGDQELKYWLAFSHIPSVGSKRLRAIKAGFRSLEYAWHASAEELRNATLGQKLVESICLERERIDPDRLVAELQRHRITAICLDDDDYPPLLRETYDPPAIIYCRGTLPANTTCLAIVGTRKISDYGARIVRDIIPRLAEHGLTTVSGMALGVDALVHETTLAAAGKTIAVLGGGLDDDNLYPSQNRWLAGQIIADGGAVISEYPPGTLPLKQHFPRRNRIISGLAVGVVIIEAGPHSGSLITADLALEQNREVMAVPGSVFAPNSTGTNELIKKGAHPVMNAADIFDCLEINIIERSLPDFTPADETQAAILTSLKDGNKTIDEIIRTTELSAAAVSSTLSLLEIKGAVKKIGPHEYAVSGI